MSDKKFPCQGDMIKMKYRTPKGEEDKDSFVCTKVQNLTEGLSKINFIEDFCNQCKGENDKMVLHAALMDLEGGFRRSLSKEDFINRANVLLRLVNGQKEYIQRILLELATNMIYPEEFLFSITDDLGLNV